MNWKVPAKLTASEAKLVARLGRKARFYVFLREIRAQLFDEAFEAELEAAYKRPGGKKPLPAAMLAMVTLLQAYDQASDFTAVESAELDKRWQLPLGCLGAEEAPFSQGVLSQFRARMVEHDLDKKLLERTVALAKETGKFGWQQLRFALDSSPLLGAGRVEDTWNLIGRALSTVVDCAAATLKLPREHVLKEAKLTLLSGPSLKATLDIDWDDDAQKSAALKRLLAEVESLQSWVAANVTEAAKQPPLQEALSALRRVLEQDLEPDPGGGMRIRDGVAKDRMPSLGDKEMRHGRKSKTKLFNGYKRHIATITGRTGLVVAAAVTPANRPEQEATPALLAEAASHGRPSTILVDRGYLGSPTLEELRQTGVEVLSKPWPTRNAGRFTKEDFRIDLTKQQLTCPKGATAPIAPKTLLARFAAEDCDRCPLRARCTNAKPGRGRSVSIHEQEELLMELRALRKTSEGRKTLRERVSVEHSLAKLSAIQGPRARYRGARRNTLDVRRSAAIVNLQVIARELKRAA